MLLDEVALSADPRTRESPGDNGTNDFAVANIRLIGGSAFAGSAPQALASPVALTERGMWTTCCLAVALVVSIALGSSALAAPREPRLIQGTLEWPPALSGGESFIVLRGDDGRVYYADVAAAQRRVQGDVGAGSQLTILGLEGTRPHEVSAVALVSGDARALIALTLPQASPTPATTPAASVSKPTAGPHTFTSPAEILSEPPPAAAAPVAPTDPSERRAIVLRGSVFGVAGRNLFIRKDDGTFAMVDISKLQLSTAQQLKPGSPIAVIAIPVGKQYLATGFPDTKTGRSGSTPAKPVR